MILSRTLYLKYKNSESILNPEQIALVKEYEEREGLQKKRSYSDHAKEYSKRVFQEIKEEEFRVNFDVFKHKFLLKYKELEGVDYDPEYYSNLDTILLYFSRDKRFFECSNLSKVSKPSFDKGLLIVGNYGNGKTSTMKTLKELFNHTPLVFKCFTANKLVSDFEASSDPRSRFKMIQRAKTGRVYFDDVKTEKEASNYGIFNLMKDIIEERYNSKLKTYITCNYAENHPDELIEALHEFHHKYGARVYDRLFQMFNVIEFKGKSKRV